MPAHFDDIQLGQVVTLGAMQLSEAMLESFNAAFAPDRDLSEGASDALLYAVWSSLDQAASANWPQTKRLAVDALRWSRNPPAGEGPPRPARRNPPAGEGAPRPARRYPPGGEGPPRPRPRYPPGGEGPPRPRPRYPSPGESPRFPDPRYPPGGRVPPRSDERY